MPSASLEAAPLRLTLAPTTALWSAPALATGAELLVLMLTLSGALLSVPSLTTSRSTYVPGRSATKRGLTLPPPVRAAVLPLGRLAKLQA